MPATKRNFLTFKQSFQLTSWVIEKQEFLRGLPNAAIATLASRDLGFVVKERNVSTAVETAGVDLGNKRASKSDNIQIVAEELVSLLTGMGMEISERLKAVAAGAKKA